MCLVWLQKKTPPPSSLLPSPHQNYLLCLEKGGLFILCPQKRGEGAKEKNNPESEKHHETGDTNLSSLLCINLFIMDWGGDPCFLAAFIYFVSGSVYMRMLAFAFDELLVSIFLHTHMVHVYLHIIIYLLLRLSLLPFPIGSLDKRMCLYF